MLRDKIDVSENGRYEFSCIRASGYRRGDPARLGPGRFDVDSRETVNVKGSVDCPTPYISQVPGTILGQLKPESEFLAVGNQVVLPLDELIGTLDIGDRRTYDVEIDLDLGPVVRTRAGDRWEQDINVAITEIRFFEPGTDVLVASALP